MKYALVFIVLFAGSAAAAGPDQVLSPAGLGSAEIGLNVEQLERTLRIKLGYSGVKNRRCSLLTTKNLEPAGISLVIESSVLTRINVDFYGTDPRPLEIKTAAGIGLGSTEEELVKVYAGRTRIEANPMDPTWHTIYVDEPDHRSALVFETNGKTVKSMRAGEYPTVVSRNGCD